MSMEERHILLRERKVLAARLVQIEAALPLAQKFRRSSADLAYARLDTKPRDIFSDKKMQLESDTVKLDISLAAFVNSLQYFAQGDLDGKSDLFSELKQGLDVRAQAMSCDGCSKFPPSVCNGTDQDDQIVNAGAACLAPLQEMFEIADEVARYYYATYGTFQMGNPDVVFGTENFSQRRPDDRPHDLPIKYFVSGKTLYFDQPGQMRAKVTLKIPVRAYDTNTYLSTLYILFHECIAHAFHAITSATARTGTKDEDRFLEGWMDWISFKILIEVLNHGQPISRARTLNYLQERLDRATNFHQARIEIDAELAAGQVSTLASARATGRSAAIKVHQLFENRPKECAQPWQKFLQMSFDLNMMSTFDEGHRESFVSVFDFLQDDRASSHTPEHNILAGLLTNYLQDNDLPALINSVVALEAKWL